jgi:hypothetical protein
MYGRREATELTFGNLRREDALKRDTAYFNFVNRNVAARQRNSTDRRMSGRSRDGYGMYYYWRIVTKSALRLWPTTAKRCHSRNYSFLLV